MRCTITQDYYAKPTTVAEKSDYMTLNFNCLVLIPSDHCNIQCAHCAPECGPTLKHGWDVNTFSKVISDSKNIPTLTKMVHLAGGEPFLYFNNLLQTAKNAMQNGFVTSVVTNGFWGYSEESARQKINALADLGLIRVELSCDSFHQEYVPMSTIKKSIRILKESDIEIILRVVTTHRHMVDYTLRQLNEDDLDGVTVAGSPMIPMGRALEAVDKNDYYLDSDGAYGSCYQMLNLTVKADGHVAICCAGSELTKSLWIGNIHLRPIDAIVEDAEWNMLIKKLIHQGPSSFFGILRGAGLENKIKPSYTNICHACSDLFNDEEVVGSSKGLDI